MKRVLGITVAILFGVAGSLASAASQDECAIWICLPGGFPSGCGAAHSAMIDRIKDGKPPLPDFGSCAVNPSKGSGSHMTFDWGIAAYIPAHQECVQWWWGRYECRRYGTVPESYVRGQRCSWNDLGFPDPPFCTRTVLWSEVFIENTLAGPTYYW